MKLKNCFKFTALCFGALLMGSCSSCNDVSKKNTNGGNQNVVTPKRVDKQSNKGTNSNSNGNVAPKLYPGLKPGEDPTQDQSKVRKIDISKAPKGMPAKKMPDNSEIRTTMQGRNFLETRRFLNHPQLAKIERLSKSPKDVTVTVFLRNGKKIVLPDGKIKDYRKDSASTILTASGVEIERPEGTLDKKKKEEILKNRPIVKAPTDQ